MNPLSYVIMLAAAAATGSVLFAAEPEPAKPAAEPAAAEAAPAKAAEPAAEVATEEEKADDAGEKQATSTEADKAPDKGASAKGSPQRFIPSEQVRADFDVSFPVDI